LSRGCRRRLGTAGLRRLLAGCAEGRALLREGKQHGYGFDQLIELEVETDPEVLWEMVQQGLPADLSPELVRGIISVGSEALREQLCTLYVVEENGALRVGHVVLPPDG
jgi:hypothetical protein